MTRLNNSEDENNIYSWWHVMDFTLDGILYSSIGQYMAHKKALLFHDEEAAYCALETLDRSRLIKICESIENCDEVYWNSVRQLIEHEGLFAKFQQNAELHG